MTHTKTLNRIVKHKKGQAFPLAAVGLFIMALSVIATLNLGQAIYEKIMLQNTADASAYTLAAMEARSFNFIALTNRVQIVHYNAAMAVQSYMNYSHFCYFVLGTIRDIIADVTSSLAFGCSVFPWPVNVPYCILRPIFQAITQVAGIIVKISEILFKIIHYIAPMAVEAMSLYNKYIVWHTQLIRLLLINAHIFSGMQDVVTKMYEKNGNNRMSFLGGNSWVNVMINAALNTLEYRATFDSGSGLNPSAVDFILFGIKDYKAFTNRSNDKQKDAVKIMTHLANASRSNKSIFNRSRFLFASWLVSNVWGDKMGATKLTTKDTPEPKIDQIRKDDLYVVGDYLSSDDYLDNGFGLGTAGISIVFLFPNTIKALGSGIVAAEKSGERKHYGYKNNGNSAAHPLGGYNGMIAFPPLNTYARASRDSDLDCSGLQAHKWVGIAPYVKFAPRNDHNHDYNQPSTWSFLTIPPKSMQGDSGPTKTPWRYKFRFNHGGTDNFEFSNLSTNNPWEHGGHSAELDTTIGGGKNNYFLFKGLNVISRGMAYYHRPENWQEHPNFFNPFWRAKLAPVGNKLTQLMDSFTKGMGGSTEGEGKVMNYFLNFVRNFLNDVFFGVVTSVITH